MTSPWEVGSKRFCEWISSYLKEWCHLLQYGNVCWRQLYWARQMTNYFHKCEIRDLRICWDRHNCVVSLNSKLSKHSIGCFWYSKKKKNISLTLTKQHYKPQPPPCGGLIHSCKFQQVCPIARSDVPLLAGAPPANPPLAMTNLLHKHPGPITINPTPGNTPQPQACTKTSFSSTGESYCPTNLSVLSLKSSGPLNHYVLEFSFSLDWRHHPQVATSVGTGALVWEGEIFVVAIAGYVF